jgi:hypothetical protein
MSTQTAAEIQADAERAGQMNQIRADEEQARQLAWEELKIANKANKAANKTYSAKITANRKAEAARQAAQIVRPSAPPQNLIVTYQAPDPGTPAVYAAVAMSPGAEYNMGGYVDDGLDIFQDDFETGIAATAVQEAQLIMPHELPIGVAFNLNDRGTLVPEAIIQPIFLQGRRPAVITDEEYGKRSSFELYPNKFLRREYNIPYDAYLNKRMWVPAGLGYMKFEPNVALHQEEIEHEAQQAKNLLEAKGPMSKTEKAIRKQMKVIHKAGGGAGVQGESQRGEPISFLKPQRTQYHRPHLGRRDQQVEFDLRRAGSIAHAQSDEYNQSKNFYGADTSAAPGITEVLAQTDAYHKGANDRAYQHWSNMALRRGEVVEAIIRQNNPQGVERAPALARADDFPVPPPRRASNALAQAIDPTTFIQTRPSAKRMRSIDEDEARPRARMSASQAEQREAERRARAAMTVVISSDYDVNDFFN